MARGSGASSEQRGRRISLLLELLCMCVRTKYVFDAARRSDEVWAANLFCCRMQSHLQNDPLS